MAGRSPKQERGRSGPPGGGLSAGARDAVRRELLAFYDRRHRALPWRDEADPYRVWVSEVMLQQTRVEAVVPYYERWLRRFPTLHALADAPLDDVLRAWQGLGYYARARNLHRAARVVREHHGGVIPGDPQALRRLPGVGDYTAGALASIAFGRREPAVDGNVRRVLSRLLDLEAPRAAQLRAHAANLVPAERPGDFNQALMELGATVCTPRAPACTACPLAPWCRAREHGTTLQRPRPRAARAVPESDVACAILTSPAGRTLLVRRPVDGLLGGMWEFPGTDVPPGDDPAAAAARLARDLGADGPRRHDTAAGNAGAGVPEPLGTVVHAFTHRRITYHAFRFAVGGEAGTDAGAGDRAWVRPGELGHYALPAAQRKLARLAGLAPGAG